MKAVVVSLFVGALVASNGYALDLAPADLKVTKVTIETPLPTGLESVVAGPPTASQLYTAIKDHPSVRPYLAAALVAHRATIEAAGRMGSMGQRGRVTVDCSRNPSVAGQVDRNFCYIETYESFGWYADISLAFKIEGFIRRTLAPRQ